MEKNFFHKTCIYDFCILYLQANSRLSCGVIGNTSGFGPEIGESYSSRTTIYFKIECYELA